MRQKLLGRAWRVPASLVMLCLLFTCRGPLAPWATSAADGSISGQALYSGRSDHSGIVVSAEPSDGLRSLSVQRLVSGAAALPRALAARTTTDAAGNFTLGGLAPGSYVVTASSEDSVEKSIAATVTLGNGQEARALVLCLTIPGEIAGTATLADASSQADGSLGIVVFIAGSSYSALTARDGSYLISGVPPGKNYTLVASKSGYDTAISTVNVSSCRTTMALPFSLSRGAAPVATGSVAGTVLLEDGPSHAGAFVYLEGSSHIAVTGDSGSYLISGVAPGSYRLMACKTGYDTASAEVTVAAGEEARPGALGLSRQHNELAPPSFSPAAGSYSTEFGLSLAAEPAGVFIRYTTDGSAPTPSQGTMYAGTPIPITRSATVRAIAYFPGWSDSPLAWGDYCLVVEAPVLSPAGGNFSSAQVLTMSTATASATIRYTLDGSEPTESHGSTYAGAFDVTGSLTVKARAFREGWTGSAEASADFVIDYGLPENPESIGAPVDGYPSWQERTLLTYLNLVRLAPQDYKARYLGWTSADPALSTWTATTPLYWSLNLNKAARYHSTEMRVHGMFTHNSWWPDDSPLDPTMTPWELAASFGATAQGQNISGGSAAFGLVEAFMDDRSVPDTPPSSFPLDNLHRYNIMTPTAHTAGAGYDEFWTVFFSADAPASVPLIPSASHDFLASGATTFWLNYYDPRGLAPQLVRLVLDGTDYALALDTGSPAAGTYRLDLPRSATARAYHFVVLDGAGVAWRYPGPGSFMTVGEQEEVDDYVE